MTGPRFTATPCARCDGDGEEESYPDFPPCLDCKGRGRVVLPEVVPMVRFSLYPADQLFPSPAWDPDQPCDMCGGSGIADEGDAENPSVRCDCIAGRRTAPIVTLEVQPHKYTEKSARARLARQRAKGVELGMIEVDGDWYTTAYVDTGERCSWTLAPVTDEVDSYPCIVLNHISYDDGQSATLLLSKDDARRILVPRDVSPGDVVAIPKPDMIERPSEVAP